MPPKTKGGFYAVRKGRVPGIYATWADCEAQTKGFAEASYKKFTSFSEAEGFISGASSSSNSKSSSKEALSSDGKSKKRTFGPEVDDVTGWDIVYSDGACKGNGKVGSYAGIGVWWGHSDPRNIAERCPGDQTNNRAELIAILRVLEETPKTRKPLLIRTDSQYSIQCFKSWISNWKRNKWKTASGGPVKNEGIIRCISTQLDIRGKLGQKVVLEYVKGHSGDTGNDGADAMANQGAMLPLVNERPWKEIEIELLQQLSTIGAQVKMPVAELTVLAPDNLAETGVEDVEAPAKVRKVTTKHPSSSKSKLISPSKVLANKIPSRSYHQDNLTPTKSLGSSSSLHPPPPSIFEHNHSFRSSTTKNPSVSQIDLQKPITSTVQKLDAATLPNPAKDTIPKPAIATLQKSKTISSLPYLSGAKSPMRVICAHPPLVPVKVEDVNPNDYADCLLDDDDLANELSD